MKSLILMNIVRKIKKTKVDDQRFLGFKEKYD